MDKVTKKREKSKMHFSFSECHQTSAKPKLRKNERKAKSILFLYCIPHHVTIKTVTLLLIWQKAMRICCIQSNSNIHETNCIQLNHCRHIWRRNPHLMPHPDTVTVSLSPTHHVLVVSGYSGSEYKPFRNFINVGDTHSCEPWLYKECLQRNFHVRAQAWRKMHNTLSR